MAKLLCGSSLQEGRVWLFRVCIILIVASVMAIRPLERGSFAYIVDSGSHWKLGVRKASTLFTKDQMEIKHTVEKQKEEQSKAGKECGNDVDEEECIDRRSLAAHTDYIYTQQHTAP